MVFARSKTKLNNIPTFKFGNIDLEQVEDYIYLGICFNWNGSFVKAKKLLHDKASKAMYSLIGEGRPKWAPEVKWGTPITANMVKAMAKIMMPVSSPSREGTMECVACEMQHKNKQ